MQTTLRRLIINSGTGTFLAGTEHVWASPTFERGRREGIFRAGC
ncbi:hypothetical protein [Micromonospora craterilacus]|nr:hypothetical protein [Micromonospora craterilacus]